jgi:signal transduction histidine kinase
LKSREQGDAKVWARKTRQLTHGLIVVSLLAYAVTAYAGYRGMTAIMEASVARTQALQALLLMQRTMTLLADLENGQRGYALTGREEFLEPWTRAKTDLPAAYAELVSHLTLELGPKFYATRVSLDQLIARPMAVAEKSIAIRHDANASEAAATATQMEGKHVMDQIRDEFSRLNRMHLDMVRDRDIEVSDVEKQTTWAVASLTAFSMALIGIAMWTLARERFLRDKAEESLHKLTTRLETLVEERTTELRRARLRIQSFAAELDLSVETERKRLAREVHDQFGQIATATKMMVHEMSRQYPDVPKTTVTQITGMLDESINTARRITADLRPPLLDDLGLEAAVTHYARNFSLRGGIACNVDVKDDEVLSAAQANQLFRILQEAVTNVVRHADASNIQVRGAISGSNYLFEVADDGVGPKVGRPQSNGLSNMRERAALAGGTLVFGPGMVTGSSVLVTLPLQTKEST